MDNDRSLIPDDSQAALLMATISTIDPIAQEKNPIKRFFKLLGPGLITGASDDDPSGIGTYTTAGAMFGLATLWTALFSFPLMVAVQFTCAKIGMVSGRGLAGVLRRHYSPWLLYPCVISLLIANTINAGTDIGAIAAAVNLMVPIPITAMILPIALSIVLIQLFGSYKLIAKVFKWLTLTLFGYIASAFFAKPNLAEVFYRSIIPSIQLNNEFIATLVAIMGTTISPYLFFWQASQVVEEQAKLGRIELWQRKGATDQEIKYAILDVNIGMFFAGLVFYFVILSSAATLHVAGKTDIQSATDAALALAPLAGKWASTLFALGLIGSGLLAVPILTGASAYAVAEAFGSKYGFDEKPKQAKLFYGVIVVSTIVGMFINYLGINPIKALFWTAVINGLLAPPLLVVILHIANNKKVMGNRTNGKRLNILCLIAAFVMFIAAIALFLTWGS